MTAPSIPGVDRDALVEAIERDAWTTGSAADAALAHIDEWVEVDEATWNDLPTGTRVRTEWVRGDPTTPYRYFVHRDDLADDPRALIARHLGTEQANTFLSWLDKNGWTVTRKGER